MLKSIRWCVWSLVALALLPVGLAAQEYVYTNNDLPGQNYISVYSVGSGGIAGEITGSPFSTGAGQYGSGGGFYAANRIIIVNNFLYASNSGSNTVSAFSITSGTGALTLVGSFPTGVFNNSYGGASISLAATPDGKYLFAGSTGSGGQITVFNIDATGGLTMTSKSPVAAGGPMSSMKVIPDGKYLLAALPTSDSPYGAIAVFAIHGPGNLRQVHNSPYVLSKNEPATSIDINCAGNLAFAGGTAGDIYVFNFASGRLSPVANSPFATGKSSSGVIALSKDDATLFSSNQGDNTVTALTVGSSGGLTVLGTSVNASDTPSTSQFTYPGGLAVNNYGDFLFAADLNGPVSSQSGLSVFALTPIVLDTFNSVDLTSITSSSTAGLESLAAYPAKVCSGASTTATVKHP